MTTSERMEVSSIYDRTVRTVDDVTRAIDVLSAHVVFMDIDEDQRAVAFDALQAALKRIQAAQ